MVLYASSKDAQKDRDAQVGRLYLFVFLPLVRFSAENHIYWIKKLKRGGINRWNI